MNRNRNPLLIICILLLIGMSCSHSAPKKSRQPVSHIVLSASQLPLGGSLKISVRVKPKGGELKRVDLYLNHKLMYSSTSTEFNYELNDVSELGRHQIKVLALKTDGREGVNFKEFDVLSTHSPEELQVKVLHAYPHNPKFFTEGLEVHDGRFYESTGEYGESSIYEFDLKTGAVRREVPLDKKYFGEGMTILRDKIYQLTYKARKGFVYDLNTLKQLDTFSYTNKEGWGLTNDGKQLIKSDGTEYIYFFNKDTYQPIRRIAVCDNKGAIAHINELEYYQGAIYANVWTTNYILKIDAQTGAVLAKIDCSKLPSLLANLSQADVLNGIAIDKSTGKIYLTGKYFDKLFEVEFVSP